MMTQVKSPGTAANVSGIGSVAWANPNNIKVSDDTYATAADGILVTLDSYVGSNNLDTSLYNGSFNYSGQSFHNIDEITLDSCKFSLKKFGLPTGNAVAKIYAHTGTYGSDGHPTGSALATSDNFDVSSLTTSFSFPTFTFSGANKITLAANTNYVIEVYYSGGDASNLIKVSGQASTSGTSGNGSWSANGSTWSTGYDFSFYYYGVSSNTSNYLKASNFGFTIPTNTVINGILVEIEEKSTTTTTENVIKIVKADGTLGTLNKSTGANLPATEGYVSYGNDHNLWGENWLPADINDADFGVVLSTLGIGVSSIDHIRITVYYGVIGPFPTFFR